MQKRRTNNQRRKATAVQITVYVVKQQRRPKLQLLSTLERRGSNRHLSPLKSPAGVPYDRKAQLLLYSQQLRATAAFLKDGSLTPIPQPHHHHKSKQHLQITTTRRHNPPHNKVQLAGAAAHPLQITAIAGNPRQKDLDGPTSPWKVVEVLEQRNGVAAEAKLPPPPPSCFGDWKKIFFPSFCAKDVGRVKRRRRKTMIASLGRKISAIMMSSRMEKERIGVIAKFLSVIGKHR